MIIILFDVVDGELLFFFAQLFPDTLRFGDVLFGKLQDVVEVVPEEAELFVAGFSGVFFFLADECRNVCSVLVVDHSDMQGGGVVVRNDFDDSVCFQLLYEAVSSARWPVENGAPAAVAVQAFTSFAHDGVFLAVGEFCFRVVDFYKKFQESFYFSFVWAAACKLLFQQSFWDDDVAISDGLAIHFLHMIFCFLNFVQK